MNDERRSEMLALARLTLRRFLEGTAPGAVAAPGEEASEGGVFVTLRHRGRLRGCVGMLQSGVPISTLVAHCAVAAATDSRFDSLREDELAETAIEITLLDRARRIQEPDDFMPGVEGLIVSRGGRRGLLLPQVAAERGWDAARFLEETCMKAGLSRDAWRSGATIEAFGAEVFGEEDPGTTSGVT